MLAVALLGAAQVLAASSKPPLPTLNGTWENLAAPAPRGPWDITGGCVALGMDGSWSGAQTHSGLHGTFSANALETGQRNWVFAGRAHVTEGTLNVSADIKFELVTPNKLKVTYTPDGGSSQKFELDRISHAEDYVSGRPPPNQAWILRSKDFVPRCATVDAGSRVTICSHFPINEKLFSYSRYNKFESGFFHDGQCIHETANNPTSAPITFKIFSVIHSQMHLVLIVLPP